MAGSRSWSHNTIAMPDLRNGSGPLAVKCQHCGRWIPTGREHCQHCEEPQQEVALRPLGGAAAPPRPSTPAAGTDGQGLASQAGGREPPVEPEPVPLPPDQEDARSWRYVSGLARADPALALLLALMAIAALASLLRRDLFGAIVGGAILWGVLTFQWWGYFIALAFAAISVLGCVAVIALGIVRGVGLAALFTLGPTLAVGVFAIVVLLRRRDRFD